MLSWWQAIVLGLVEGITEYLPVSSTGHLILTASLLGLDGPERKDAIDAYLTIIQGGAILAIAALYWPRLVGLARGLAGRDRDGLALAGRLAVAFAPVAVVGLVAGSHIRRLLFGDWTVLAGLVAGGVAMIWLGGRPRVGGDDIDTMSWRTALGIGVFQLLALWPGMSRSMATIAGGMLLGLNGVAAAEFSFLLGLPTLGAACLFDVIGELRRAGAGGRPSMFDQLGPEPVLLGIIVATASAAVAVRWLVHFLNRHGLAPFGWYRLAVAAAFAALLWSGALGN